MLTEEEKLLIDEIVPYVIYKVSKNHFHFPIKKEDVISEILDNVATKFKNYNPNLNELIPYLDKCISGWICNHYNRTQKPKSEGEQEHTVIWEEHNEYEETERDISDKYWEDRRDEIIMEEINKLDNRLKIIIKYCYYDNYTLQEVGDILGYTRERIRQLRMKAEGIIKPRIAMRLKELSNLRSDLWASI